MAPSRELGAVETLMHMGNFARRVSSQAAGDAFTDEGGASILSILREYFAPVTADALFEDVVRFLPF